jgi:hypothetical protein
LISADSMFSVRLPKSRSDVPKLKPTSQRPPPHRRHTKPPDRTVFHCPDKRRWRMWLSHFSYGPRAVVNWDASRLLRSARGLRRLVQYCLWGIGGAQCFEQRTHSGWSATRPSNGRNHDLGMSQPLWWHLKESTILLTLS